MRNCPWHHTNSTRGTLFSRRTPIHTRGKRLLSNESLDNVVSNMKAVWAIRLAHSWNKLATEKCLRCDTMCDTWGRGPAGDGGEWGGSVSKATPPAIPGSPSFQTPQLTCALVCWFTPTTAEAKSWVQFGWMERESMKKKIIIITLTHRASLGVKAL